MPAAGAGGMMPDAGAGDDPGGAADSDDNVVVTVCSDGQGGFVIYAGDEPESGDSGDDDTGGDGMGADAGAMGAGGGAAGGDMGGAPQGQPADSVGAALKIIMTILQENQSSQGGAGSSEDQFAAGFSGSQSPTPAASRGQKY